MKSIREMDSSERFVLKWDTHNDIEHCKHILKQSAESFVVDRGNLFNPCHYFQLPYGSHSHRIYSVFENLLKEMSGADMFIEQIDILTITDDEWNAERNKGLESIYYTKHIFKPDYLQSINERFGSLLNELQEISDELDRLEKEEKIEKEERETVFQVRVLKKEKVFSREGTDYEVLVDITDGEQSLKFNCRNIFDYGYVINPAYPIEKGRGGGLRVGDFWQKFEGGAVGWTNVRELTEFEKKCYDYLVEFPPVSKAINM